MNKAVLLCLIFTGVVLSQGDPCSSSDGGSGTCVDTDDDDCDGGILEPGFCSGPSNIECCVTSWGSCTANGQQGECIVSSACNGTAVAGFCPGPSSVQCCVSGGGQNGTVSPCGSQWVDYSQCDPSWANNQLGTSSSDTICSAGCAMTSVAMILASAGESINGATINPANLNSWLTNNGGYVSEDDIVWGDVSGLGGQGVVTDTTSMDIGTLQGYVNSCNGVVVLVRGGTHYVLVTGYESGTTTFYVNDPGFNQQTYDYSDMSQFVAYGPGLNGKFY